MKDNKDKNTARAAAGGAPEKEQDIIQKVERAETVPEPADAVNAAQEAAEGAVNEAAAADVPVSEAAMRRAEVAEAEQAVRDARQEITSSRQQYSKASREAAEAKKTLATRKRQARQAELIEKRQKRQDAAMKSKEELHQELERRKQALQHTTAELSGKLKQLLSGDLKAMQQREKQRLPEMLSVFAKHNFYANGFTPVEMRTTLEDLGPTYVKIGQIMSSRVDMLPESYCKELGRLRSNVKPLDPAIARAVIEQETGMSIDDIYSEFRDAPLGSASIGQVHYGVLKDGTRVVTKVQRPLIAEMMRKDFVLLKKLAGLVNVVSNKEDDGDAMVDLQSVIEELEKVTEEELDFRMEAENTRFFRENCIDDPEKIDCPVVIDSLTTERIFTMTFVDGYSVSKKERLIEDGYDPMEIGRAIVENYIHQVMDVGTFHADPHQGNIMVSHGKPVWIDFGMIGRLADADINTLQNLILSMLGKDLDAIVNVVMSMGAASPKTNRNKLLEDAEVMFDKYLNVTSISEMDMSVLLNEVMDLATNNHISLPGKYTMLARSVVTIEGVIEELCPDLNLFELVSNKFMDRARKSLDVEQELISFGKGVLEVGKKASRMPGMAYDALNNMVRGRMKLNLELTGYEELLDKAAESVRNIILAVFACVLFFGSCILCTTEIQPQTSSGMPVFAAFGLLFSVALAIFAVKRLSKSKKKK